MKKDDPWIERRIITGLITSTDYIRAIMPFWNIRFLEAQTARTLATWCLDYFNSYNRAPGADMEGIFTQKLKAGLPPDQAEEIELILRGLSEEAQHTQFNVDYLLDQTRRYFQEQNLQNFSDDIKNELIAGSVEEAEKVASSYRALAQDGSHAIDPFANPTLIKLAFEEQKYPLIKFGKALGRMWDAQMSRDSFVALMGPEKRGKTFWLIELAMRAADNGCNVVFFQAGDMSEKQMIRRLCIYLAKRSDKQRYCEEMYLPVVDCWNNQTGRCKKSESKFGVFDTNILQENVTYDMLVDLHRQHSDYKTCHNCGNEPNVGAVWLKYQEATEPLNYRQAWSHIQRWRKRHKRTFKLCTYPNETLTFQEINTLLDSWEKQEGFVPDVIIIDYLDIMAPDADSKGIDHRNQENKKWQRGRRLSQQKHCLVLTATQSDADSYTRDLLTMKNFSEDKRKYAHVTAMYGLNQNDVEKRLGIMRINEIVVREGDFDSTNSVRVLQRLQTGRPFLGSLK